MTTVHISLASALAVLTALCLTFAPATSAHADDEYVRAYTVPKGKHVNSNHEGAAIVVTKPGAKYGLFFMEIDGANKYKPFTCENAGHKSGDKIWCTKIFVIEGTAVEETVTVGLLGGDFCKKMRRQHNNAAKKIIYEKSDCSSGKKCICYEVKHMCWKNGGYNKSCPQSLLDDALGGAGVDNPPGNGAGSGGSH